MRDLRRDLQDWLPELEGCPPELLEAIDLVTSFEVWDRLRSQQRLGVARASETMERALLPLALELG